MEASTVGEALKALDVAHPGFAERLFDDGGALRRFVNVFLADEDVRFLQGLSHTGRRRSDAFDRAGRRRRLLTTGALRPYQRLRRRHRRGWLLALEQREC